MPKSRAKAAAAESLTPGLARPEPPFELTDVLEASEIAANRQFCPAPDMAAWMRAALIDDGGPICNPDHWHLKMAHIGVLWTNVPMKRNQIPIAGMAEMPMPQGNKWSMERQKLQLCNWFGQIPDFIITLYAPAFEFISDAGACAICDHELYHCAFERGDFGAPKFNRRTGKPKFAILGHDVEEFVGVTRRWGVGHSAGRTAQLVAVANLAPEIAQAQIDCACGNCNTRF